MVVHSTQHSLFANGTLGLTGCVIHCAHRKVTTPVFRLCKPAELSFMTQETWLDF